jgi:hypothetical protein
MGKSNLKEWRGTIDGEEYHVKEPTFLVELKFSRECTEVDWNTGAKVIDEEKLCLKQIEAYVVDPKLTFEEISEMSPSVASAIMNVIRSFAPIAIEKK